MEVSEEVFDELERELLQDLEETIQEQLSAYRNFRLHDYEDTDYEGNEDEFYDDIQEIPPFYWGGEDCCEMIFLDESSQM